MKNWLALSIVIVCMTVGTSAFTADAPYDENADSKAAVTEALAAAQKANKKVLLVFGANWCADCLALDKAFKTEKNAGLLAQQFEVVKINVGRYDHNVDLIKAYGEPTKKGIPSVVVLSPDNTVLYTTKAGELANARRMNDDGVYGFFRDVVASAEQGKH